MAAMICVGVYFTLRKMLSPLKKTVEMIRAIGEGNFDMRLKLGQHDEIGAVGSAMDKFAGDLQNLMTEKTQLQQELVQAQKMESIGRLDSRLFGIGKGHMLRDILPGHVGERIIT